eukprot:SAG31_NODE_5691_length_2378_cov_1.097850_3_plen_138_part_00
MGETGGKSGEISRVEILWRKLRFCSFGCSIVQTVSRLLRRVPAADVARVLDNLDFREKGGYTRAVVDVHSLDGSRTVQALVYTANSSNPLFLGAAALADTAGLSRRIASSVGPSGPNVGAVLKKSVPLSVHVLQVGK